MRYSSGRDQSGFTLVELVVGLTILALVSISLTGLFTSLVDSAEVAKQKAEASALATNQMEYLKSLPYDNLAVAGGSIFSTTTIPGTTTKKINGVTYTVKTSINYVDDAYDGCAQAALSFNQTYCRGYPPPSGAPAADTNPADYKIADVTVYNPGGQLLAEVDTEISAQVAETASNTGALFVTVVDDHGNPVVGATVNITNSKVGPVSVSDNTDQNGKAIFYDLPADSTAYDYVITASEAGYSTLTTIVPVGVLQPTYSNQKIISQQSSSVTLTIMPQGSDSLLVETTDPSGNPLGNVKVYLKGGYKRYTAASDNSYCYDNMTLNGTTTVCSVSATVSDKRLLTDSITGMAGLSKLVPGPYIFCGDQGSTNCQIGGITYYLAAALPYSGANPFNPITVPTYDPSSPPSTTFAYDGTNYYQKVRLILTPTSTFPRVSSITPSDVSLTTGSISNFGFQITGFNLPCSATAGSCSTEVQLTQGSNTYIAACTGTDNIHISCTANLSSASAGNALISITANGSTLNLPNLPLMGGISVTP